MSKEKAIVHINNVSKILGTKSIKISEGMIIHIQNELVLALRELEVSLLLGSSSVLSNMDLLKTKTIAHLTKLSSEIMVPRFAKSMPFPSTWQRSYPWSRTMKREEWHESTSSSARK